MRGSLLHAQFINMGTTRQLGFSQLGFLLLAAGLGGTIVVMGLQFRPKKETVALATAVAHTAERVAPPCDFVTVSLSGFRRARPVLYSEPECPSTALDPIRDSLALLVLDHIKAGDITNASVYFRDMTNNQWTVVNDSAEYKTSSTRRMSVLLTYLRMAEQDPDLFARSFQVDGRSSESIAPYGVPVCSGVLPGRRYTVRQLLESDVKCSDDLANSVLMHHIDKDMLRRTVQDLRGNDGRDPDKQYPTTARRYAVSMKALYESDMLSPMVSDYAMNLLVDSGIRTGLTSGVPDSVQVARRFSVVQGDDGRTELHECAVFYLEPKPYMVSIMTQGQAFDKLPGVIQDISRFVYRYRKGTHPVIG